MCFTCSFTSASALSPDSDFSVSLSPPLSSFLGPTLPLLKLEGLKAVTRVKMTTRKARGAVTTVTRKARGQWQRWRERQGWWQRWPVATADPATCLWSWLHNCPPGGKSFVFACWKQKAIGTIPKHQCPKLRLVKLIKLCASSTLFLLCLFVCLFVCF